jgi:hypothetical protein
MHEGDKSNASQKQPEVGTADEPHSVAPFAFPQRALAAFAAAFFRCAAVMVTNRRFPPICPPLRPIAAMYAEMLAGAGGVGKAA